MSRAYCSTRSGFRNACACGKSRPRHETFAVRRSIKVFLGADPRLVGVIRYNAEGARESAGFEYEAGWLSAADRFSIDPALPLVPGIQFHRKSRDGSIFNAVVADTEPDGWSRRVILR